MFEGDGRMVAPGGRLPAAAIAFAAALGPVARFSVVAARTTEGSTVRAGGLEEEEEDSSVGARTREVRR